jgi:CSLREA domain-containing protein
MAKAFIWTKRVAAVAAAAIILSEGLAAPQNAHAASFVVNTLVDENNGIGVDGVSLREAIAAANTTEADGPDTITFSVTGTIDLMFNGQLAINNSGAADSLTIQAPAAFPGITITASGNSRVINVSATSTATLQRLTITGGSAFPGGGIQNSGNLTILESTIRGNIAPGTGTGGGINNATGATLTLTNSTVSGNTAAQQGGGIASDGALTLNSCTVTANTGSSTAGGVHSGSGTPKAAMNTIIAGNTGGASPDVLGAFNSLSFNLIGNANGATGFANGVNNDQVGSTGSPINPRLGPLQDNGGPTRTHALRTIPGDSSPAFQTGSTALATDQRGAPRVTPDSIGAFDPGNPLAVELESFDAVAPARFAPVSVTWTTSAEIDNLGFYVYRAQREGDARSGSWALANEPLNAELIPSRGTPSRGADYLWLDHESSASATDARAYFLVDLDLTGRETVHGPAFVRVLDGSATQAFVETLDASESASAAGNLKTAGRTSR